jgi:hypothetical protein
MNDNKPGKPAAVMHIEAAIEAIRQQGTTSAYGIAKALFADAEAVAKAFASQQEFPWYKVVVLLK